MRTLYVFVAGFVCGVLVATPPWAMRYLLIGIVLVCTALTLHLTRDRTAG